MKEFDKCFCVNPSCDQRGNFFDAQHCNACGIPLKINSRYKLIAPLTELIDPGPTEVFEALSDNGEFKVIKTLFRNDEQYFRMFEREVSALRSLSHPAIPKLFVSDQFIVNLPGNYKLYGFAMEKVPGKMLQKQLDSRCPISSALGLDWLKQMTEVLHYIHQQKLFHRDIKPSNIILKDDGRVVLIDFGGVRSSKSSTYLTKVATSDVTRLSSSGYTPPEQENGRAIPQSDIFALGRMLIYLLTGRQPFELSIDEGTGQLLWRNHAKKLDLGLAKLLDRMTALAPGDRPANTDELLGAIEKLGQRKPWSRAQLIALMLPVGALVMLLSFGGQEFSRRFRANMNFYSARELRSQGEINESRSSLERSIRLHPTSVALSELAEICEELSDNPCVTNAYQKAIQLDPTWRYYFELGFAFDKDDNTDQAVAAYEQAIAMAPNEAVEAYNNLARLKILQGQTGIGVELSYEGLKYPSDSVTKSNLHKNLGWGLLLQNELAEAKEALEESTRLNKDNAAAYCLQAKVSDAQGQNSRDDRRRCLSLNYDQPEVKDWREEYLD